jgi:hypothetical protein
VTMPAMNQPGHPEACPHPQDGSIPHLEFEKKPMVDWLAPGELARAGVKAAVAATFGSYADKRELQAALADADTIDDTYEAKPGGLWFDYAADLGDGFDATYSIARLLAMDLELELDGATHATKRGEFVILGGDQVYPTASRDEYQNRFLGPYRAALPYVEHNRATGKIAPAIYALPGNHDWYDGLTAFLRIFCQRKLDPKTGIDRTGRWIGGWRTRQRRSYFAVKLPNDWWVWAIDSQLESDMDHPQLLYFEKLSKQIVADGADPAKQKIILITAEPSWVNCSGEGSAKTCRHLPEAFNTLAHFEKNFIRKNEFQLKLVLSGDLHHYVRYESADAADHTMRITSGGGGAYLLGTEQMPDVIGVREGTRETVAAQEPVHTYRKKGAFPSTPECRALANDVWWLPFRNRAFGLMLGGVYLLFMWLLQTGSRLVPSDTPGAVPASLLEHLVKPGVQGDVRAFWDAMLYSPMSMVFTLLIVFGLAAFTSSSAKGHRSIAKFFGFMHGIAHVLLACALMGWAAIAIAMLHESLRPGRTLFNFVLLVVLLFLGWLFGSWLFATYIFFSSRLTGVHTNEVYSSMFIADYKNFLRMRLNENGTLTVFAIGLRKVANDWTFVPPGPDDHGKPWFQSKKFNVEAEYRPHVIEMFELK